MKSMNSFVDDYLRTEMTSQSVLHVAGLISEIVGNPNKYLRRSF